VDWFLGRKKKNGKKKPSVRWADEKKSRETCGFALQREKKYPLRQGGKKSFRLPVGQGEKEKERSSSFVKKNKGVGTNAQKKKEGDGLDR